MQKVLYDRRSMIHPASPRAKEWWEYSWWDLFAIKSEMGEDRENVYDEYDSKSNPSRSHSFLFGKRKRQNSGAVNDTISVVSSNASVASEPQNKKSKRLSLAGLFSTPMKPVLKLGTSLQGSTQGLKPEACDEHSIIPPRRNLLRRSCSILRSTPTTMGPPASVPSRTASAKSKEVPTLGHNRLTRTWSQSVACLSSSLPQSEVKRQEAIYELYSGEHRMVEDLGLVKTTYRSSLLQLNILTEQEAQCIFGDLDQLLFLHTALRDQLAALRDPSGVVKCIANVLLNWIPGLECYVTYCTNHVRAKAVLDQKKETSKRFQDFLQRCLESPFSRKLDLWTFLDVPRSRLVKYPLLIGEILRHTPPMHPDTSLLPKILSMLTKLLQQADKATGEAECEQVVNHLVFASQDPQEEYLDGASAVICSGELKDHRGNKYHCFLFNTGFLLTRPLKQEAKFAVCSKLIPATELEVGDVDPLRPSRNTQRTFRVSCNDFDDGEYYLLTASDEHSKKRWMDSIRQVILDSESSSHRPHPCIVANT